MATKSKTKAGLHAKKGAKKGAVKKKKRAISGGIGVISTIAITREMKQAIKTGVGNSNISIKFTYVGSYKEGKLKKKFDRLNGDARIGLIITVGGNKVYDQAAIRATKPFISLLGAAPATPDDFCYGGYELRSYALNSDRVNLLTDPAGLNFPRTKIVLLRNPNSSQSIAEVNDWRNNIHGGRILEAGADGTDENNSSTFEAAFGSIPSGSKAVVISADPFFQESMDELVAAANDSKKYICYPLQDYANAFDPPEKDNAVAIGPSLLDSYEDIGALASDVLADGQKRSFEHADSSTKYF